MQAVDREVLNQLARWLEAGASAWLATVVGTWGSSPRPIGSLFACNQSGSVVGSLSGGCVEDDLLEKLTTGQLARETAQYFEYGVTAEETEKFGLPCGGSLYIIIEPIPPTAANITQIQALCSALEQRQCMERKVVLASGALQSASIRPVKQFTPLRWDAQTRTLTQVFGPRHQLFIIGAGMVSRYLAEMAMNLDFEVTVCDPRDHLLDDFAVNGARRICDMPDDAIRRYASDQASAIVALTHDPRIDDMGLMEALKTDAFYVGAMGSRRTSESRRARLLELDVTEVELNRLRAPIGLPIGSKTPPEIAVAIIAEIVAVQHGQAAHARAVLSQQVA